MHSSIKDKIGLLVIILLLLVPAFIMLYQSGWITADPKVEVKADNCYEKTLTVITDEDYRPYSFYDKYGNYSGHDVELIIMVANEMKVNLDLKFMNWNDAIEAVTSGQADVLMTCDYSDSFPGVEKLLKSETVSYEEFVVYSKNWITSADALYGKRIAVMKDGNVMSEINKKNLGQYCIEYPDNRQAMLAVINDEADCIAVRQTVGTVLLKELEAKGIKGFVSLGQSDMCFCINSSEPELTQRINEALENLKSMGELERLREKWLTTFVQPYTFSELLEKNIWVILIFIVLGALTVIAFVGKKNEKQKAIEEEIRNAQVIEQLAQDFGCVNYIEYTANPETDVVSNYRVSEKLKKMIPNWERETNFSRKLDLLRDNLVYEQDRQKFDDEIRRDKVVKAFEKSDVYFVNTRLFFDNKIQYYQMKFTPVYENGKLKGIVAGLHSVDAKTRSEMALQNQLKDALTIADSASRAKTEFLFNMSHDIRTPMNAILGYTDMGIRHVNDVEKTKDSFLKIKASGKHLLELINDILEMSRIESGKLFIAKDPIDIREAINGVDNMCKILAIPKSIDYETIIGEIRNPYILSDELHINEIVINLISNAIKYTPDGGKVRYRVSQLDDTSNGYATYRLEISDNGIGMSEEFQKHLFEAFAREEAASVSKTEGAGLGLSIVKNIVDMTGGTISVKSKQGEGSTFTVDIPFKLMNEQEIEQFLKYNSISSFESNKTVELTGKRVLLVEDNEMNREIAIDILEEAGLLVDAAEDGEIAVETVLDKGINHYDFILMDIQMPIMNGYEATKAIRALPDGGKVPIIALSANAFEEDKQKSLEAGMNAHIAKPIDVKVLFDTMQKLVR